MCGLPARATNFRNRRSLLKAKSAVSFFRRPYARLAACAAFTFAFFSPRALWAQGQGAVKFTLAEAIQLALHHNHNLLAARTTIQQNQAQEITVKMRPSPTVCVDW